VTEIVVFLGLAALLVLLVLSLGLLLRWREMPGSVVFLALEVLFVLLALVGFGVAILLE
jgi:hypothetical protein